MKHRLYLVVLLAAITLSGMAQTIGEAFYIYRNDGGFNAFFRDEVISIEYSYEDAEGNTYDEIVAQIVNTADSVYKIPLAAIDSISFIQPEIILQPNVVQMKETRLTSYLKAVDGMTLLFDNSIPKELQPQVDNVLLYTDFDSPILKDGFVGKVLKTEMTSDAFRVECDSIYDIFDIFEQLIAIEKIEEESVVARRKAKGEWTSSRNPLIFNLGYSHPLSDGEISLSGSVDGTYIATVAYKITRKEQYFNLRLDHGWQYGAHLNLKDSKDFGTLLGTVTELPAIRFPAVAPMFKFQVSGCPFVKGEGNMEIDFSLSSPVHSYVTQVIYHNGNFSGWNHKKPVEEDNGLSFETTFSLNGSVQLGYMVDFWLGLDVNIKGIAKNFLKLGTGLDLYVGPKISGDFTMKLGTEAPINFYSIYKDSKLGLSLLTVDYEFFGEAALLGHKFPRGVFCNGTFQSPLYHEWYLLPEFPELLVSKDDKNKEATITSTPTRDILFPFPVGLGLYDSEDRLLATKYESEKYKRENEGFLIKQTFSSLKQDMSYTVKPFIKILGEDIPALPGETFKLERENIVFSTENATEIKETSAILTGKVANYDPTDESIRYVFVYSTSEDILNSPDGRSVEAVCEWNGNMTAEISDLTDYTTYYFALVIKRGDADYEINNKESFSTLVKVATVEDPTVTSNTATLQGTCSRGVTIAGFSVKKDGDYEYTQYSAVPDDNGNFSAIIDGLKADSKYYYYAFAKADDVTYPGEEFTFMTKEAQLCPDDHHPHMIDLGLPSGIKWACCNVGASAPEANGNYYAWGDVIEKTEFSIDTYSHREFSESAGCEVCTFIGEDISGTEYDIAHSKWNSPWCMPSIEDFTELKDNCEVYEATYKGETGIMFVSSNGNRIFLKAQGYRDCCDLHGTEQGVYWTSTYSHEVPIEAEWQRTIYAYVFQFYGDNTEINGYHSRVYGYSVRPIAK